MKRNIIIAALVLIFHYPSSLQAQNENLSALNEIASQYYNSPQKNELSRWVHLDKYLYTPGSDLWFSVYQLKAPNYVASVAEKILYADLINENDSLIRYVLLNKQGLSLSGHIKLPDSLSEGKYKFRVYTKSMMEKNPEQVAITPLFILNPGSANSSVTIGSERIYRAPGTPSVQFHCYPEGGSIISGVNNKIVVTAFDADGKPLEVEGKLTNLIDTASIRFHTNTWGLGAITLMGIKNRKYVATMQYQDQKYSEEIPASPAVAWQLSVVERTGNMVKLRVSLSDSLYKIKPVSYVIGVAGGRIFFAANGKGMYEMNVPLTNFHAGIATFKLYNEQKQLVSNRAVYKQEESVSVSITTNQKVYDPREWVKMDVNVNDYSGKPAASRFSVSVTDDVYEINPTSDSLIRVRLLLNDWLVNKSFCPEQLSQLIKDNQSLDWAMISQEHKTVENSVSADVIAEGLTINGRAFNKKNLPLSNYLITLFSNHGGSIVKTATTDDDGNFSFSLPDFFGTTLINFQVSDPKSTVIKDAILRINDPAPPKWSSIESVSCPSNYTMTEDINRIKLSYYKNSNNFKKAKILKVVTVSTYYKAFNEIIDKKRVNKDSWIATPEMLDQVGDGSTANLILSAPGVMLMGGFVTIQGGMRGISGVVNAAVEPLVIVNGVQLNVGGGSEMGIGINQSPVMNFLNTFSARNIDFIEVLTGSQGAQYGTVGGNGVILVYTNASPRTGLSEKDNKTGMHAQFIKGYHLPETFPSPDYSEKQKKSDYAADNRTTLYWNGQSGTDSTGKMTIRFYCSDHPGPYTVTIRGVAADGSLFIKTAKINSEFRKPVQK